MDKLQALEEEQKILEDFLKKQFIFASDIGEIEFELKRYNNALAQENERNRKNALSKLKEYLDWTESSKRGKVFGEKPKGVPVPPRIREFVNETIHNIQSRLPDTPKPRIDKPNCLTNENVERDKNN